MAGLFYNNKQDHQDKDHNEDKSNNYLYLYKDEIYNNNKGFEIWPPQYFQQELTHHHQVAPAPTNLYSFGMVPSGSSSHSNNNRSSNRSLYFNVVSDHEPTVRSLTGGFTLTKQGSMNCQDCGNQAKKDCPHMRCRTCCKSRGFDCQTHVKSTWVPAAKRRERQAQLASLPVTVSKRIREGSSGGGDEDHDEHGGGGSGSRGNGCGGSTSIIACNRVVNASSSGLEASHLPPEISSPAVFRCMRVSSIEDDNEEYAYQTAVSIGGHVFKGILYDQGPADDHHHRYICSSLATNISQDQQLSLLASTASAATTTANNNRSIDPSSVYTAVAAPLNAFGTPFFAPTRS